ncbi:MAG TPA: MazG nucleotide pyrophosphohydrolase domain-containing protein [archaeon]|nr:MazG nucleotide pyrophosphohydrolase domain-containing protein [archaeon]
MHIKEAQEKVAGHLKEIGYTKIETTPSQAFLHLVEEVGETARTLLYKETNRKSVFNKTAPKELEEEVADIFWQTLKLASYLEIDLEDAFIKKFEKNKSKAK